jgi:hypothetical protein
MFGRAILLVLMSLMFGPISAFAFSIDLNYSKDFSISGSFATVSGWVDSSDTSKFHFQVDLDSGLNSTLVGGDNFGMDKFFFNTDLTLTAGMFTFVDPEDWEVKFDKVASEYGKFSILAKGTGDSRTQSLNFYIDYSAVLTESNFLLLSLLSSEDTGGAGHFAAHIGGFDYSDSHIESTFVRDGSPEVPVPEPATFLLLGSGLLCLGWYSRKRQQKSM